jgi:hypothetical protein
MQSSNENPPFEQIGKPQWHPSAPRVPTPAKRPRRCRGIAEAKDLAMLLDATAKRRLRAVRALRT